MIKSGLAIEAAAAMAPSEMANSMHTSCEVESTEYRRWESELCAVHRKRIFMVLIEGRQITGKAAAVKGHTSEAGISLTVL